MMKLLVDHGADVNAVWRGFFPVIASACEALDPATLQWLLRHGANPERGAGGTALDDVLGTYVRSPKRLRACIEALLEAGGTTRYPEPALLDLLRGRIESLAARIDEEPQLVNKRFPEFDFGLTAGRRMSLRGATLLHVAAEFHELRAVALLLERGADVNARAEVGAGGVGGQTAVFHAASQWRDGGLPVVELLIEAGAELSIRPRLPGHYERPDEIVECDVLDYATRFGEPDGPTVKLLRNRAANH